MTPSTPECIVKNDSHATRKFWSALVRKSKAGERNGRSGPSRSKLAGSYRDYRAPPPTPLSIAWAYCFTCLVPAI